MRVKLGWGIAEESVKVSDARSSGFYENGRDLVVALRVAS